MKTKIEQALQVLIGQEFTNNGGAVSMEFLHFGVHSIFEKNGYIKGIYRLHIQSPWRIIQDDKLLIGYFDIYEPDSEHQDVKSEDFDYTKGNLRDEKMKQLLQKTPRLKVETIQVDNMGGFVLYFSKNTRLEVIPMSTKTDGHNEYWRFINQEEENNPHFVVKASDFI